LGEKIKIDLAEIIQKIDSSDKRENKEKDLPHVG